MCEFELPDVSLRCFVAMQLLLQIYALSCVKFPGLELRLCIKDDKYQVCMDADNELWVVWVRDIWYLIAWPPFHITRSIETCPFITLIVYPSCVSVPSSWYVRMKNWFLHTTLSLSFPEQWSLATLWSALRYIHTQTPLNKSSKWKYKKLYRSLKYKERISK